MKKKFICLLLSMLCVFAFVGCGEYTEPETIEQEKMTEFMEIYCEGTKWILVHKETKVMYLFVKSGYGGGLTVMVDENGNPLLWGE